MYMLCTVSSDRLGLARLGLVHKIVRKQLPTLYLVQMAASNEQRGILLAQERSECNSRDTHWNNRCLDSKTFGLPSIPNHFADGNSLRFQIEPNALPVSPEYSATTAPSFPHNPRYTLFRRTAILGRVGSSCCRTTRRRLTDERKMPCVAEGQRFLQAEPRHTETLTNSANARPAFGRMNIHHADLSLPHSHSTDHKHHQVTGTWRASMRPVSDATSSSLP